MSLLLAAMLASPQVLPFINRAELRTLARTEAMQPVRLGRDQTPSPRAMRGDQRGRPVQVAAR